MRPTTSTNNSKTSGKPFEKLRSWVPLSEIKIQFNNLTKFLRLVVSVVLPTQDIILNEIAARRVKFGFEILVLERKFVNREGKWNWLIVISTMATDGAENLCQIMAGRSLFLFTKFPGIMRNGREEAGESSYRKRKYEFTRRKLRNHET
jgi:hypothetical protein